MPYSQAQLAQHYTLVNRGQAPSAATQAQFSTLAQLNQAGSQSDATALAVATRTSQTVATTDVLLATYQFFTGVAPTSAGLDYLVNNPGSGFNTSYFNGTGNGSNGQPASATNIGAGGFNLENRYYNEAVALVTSSGATAAAFAANYGSLSIAQTIQTAYAAIVGASEVGSAAVQAATASIATSLSYFTQIANERAGGVDVGGQPGQNIALKAVIIGYILEEGLKADVGLYARAIDNFNAATALGAAAFNINILTTYGVSGANDLGAAIIYSATTPVNNTLSNLSYRSTTFNDTLTVSTANISGVTVDLAGGNDLLIGASSYGVVAVAGTPTVLLAGDGNDTIGRPIAPLLLFGGDANSPVTLDGGSGTDTLNLFAASNILVDSGVSITGFETVNIQTSSNAPTRLVDASRITGATTLSHQGATGAQGDLTIGNIPDGTALSVSSAGASGFVFTAGALNPSLAIVGSQVGPVSVYGASGTLTLAHSTAVTIDRLYFTQSNVTDSSTAAVTIGLLGFIGTSTPGQSHVVDVSSSSNAAVTYITTANGGGVDTVKLSAGADVLKLGFVAAGNTLVTLGAGSDIVYVAGLTSNAVDYIDGSGGTRAGGNVSINAGLVTVAAVSDFAKGVDHINLELGTGVYTSTVGNAAYGQAATILAAGQAAASLIGTGGTTLFEYGVSTFIYQDNGNGTFDTGDLLVRLTGVTGLTVGGLNTSDIHFG